MISRPRQQPGTAPMETAVYLFSLRYPFSRPNDIHRNVFLFKEDAEGNVFVDRLRYSELSGSQKQRIRKCQARSRLYFLITVVVMVCSLPFGQTVSAIVLLAALLMTFYEVLDRRIQFLYLRREYRLKEFNAKNKPAFRSEEDRTAH
jgi:VanZ family protein